MDLIDAIGTVTLNSEGAIDAAQEAFNGLSVPDRNRVTNRDVLEDAVAELKRLRLEDAQKRLNRMNVVEDRFNDSAFYYPTCFPYYHRYGYWGADVRCFILPYMGVKGDYAWMRMVCDYTSNSWLFFEKIIIKADDQKFTLTFDYFDVTRDNDWNDIWEYVDIPVGQEELEILEAIADSQETIVRFESDRYYDDFTVNQKDKNAIREMLDIYAAFQ